MRSVSFVNSLLQSRSKRYISCARFVFRFPHCEVFRIGSMNVKLSVGFYVGHVNTSSSKLYFF